MIEPQQIIKDFVETGLDGDISKLKGMDFSILNGDRKFGCPGRSFDCDDTNLARAIYAVAFKDAFPEMTMESFTVRKYRGDTVNTFRTLMGRFSENYAECEELYSLPSDLLNRVHQFIHKYHSIGNFVPLPNLKTTQTLNTMRSSVWKDYFHRFWCEMENYLQNSPSHEKFFHLLEANGFALDSYKGMPDGFYVLSERLMLEDFSDRNMRPFFPNWTLKKKLPVSLYVGAVEHYIDFCSRFIDERSERIIKKVAALI